MPALEQGLVQVYTGAGKGKTTAALGLVLRAAGWQLGCFVVQFMKQQPSGEEEAVRRLSPYVRLERFGRPQFLHKGTVTEEDRALARRGLDRGRAALISGEYDLVVLDEILTAVSFGLLPEADVLGLMDDRPRCVELVMTGRDAPESILARADLITRMVEERHPYARGIKARRGIEY
ncbi:MAG: cob(I)yrinic acid a,c-diamide adenosyltransferase [Anaerolineae bacterium]